MKKGKKFSINIYAIIVFTVLVAYTITLLFPLFWGIMTSLKAYTQFEATGSLLDFPQMTYWEQFKIFNQNNPDIDKFQNYDNIFGNYSSFISNITIRISKEYKVGLSLNKKVSAVFEGGLGGYVLNTILYVGGSAFFSTLAPCIMAYMCAKYDYKLNKIIYAFVLFVMIMPIFGTTSAMIVLMRRLGLYNTIWGMWIKSFSFSSTYFLVFYAIFKSMSNTYSEAAQIDGASHLRVMFGIYLPLAINTFSTIFLLQFFVMYNDYNAVLLFLPTKPTLSYAVWYLTTGLGGALRVPEQLAASMFLALPMLILFIIFKKKLMGNISLGGIKE